jgi:hypothetical protein
MSRADQSLTRQTPKIRDSASSIATGTPADDPDPMKNPSSAS